MINYEKKQKKEMDLYMRNRSLRIERLQQWNAAQDIIFTEFQNFVTLSKEREFGKEYSAYPFKDKNVVQISFGTLPIARSIDGKGIDVESGASLAYSILPSGMVFCTVFFCSSERLCLPKKYLLLRTYKYPSKITANCVKRDLFDLLRYQRISSSIQYSSWWEKRLLQRKLSDENTIANVLNVSVSFVIELFKSYLLK